MEVRELAYDILSAVYKKKAYSNIELSQKIRESNLSDKDRAFLTRLVYGVLQHNQLLDYEIKAATVNKNITPDMRTILKEALYQLRHMDRVPDFAVINETVEIVKRRMGPSAGSFANAVLRTLQRTTFIPKREDFKDELAYLSLVYSHPEWIVRMVAKHYGDEVAINWMINNQKEAPLSIRVNGLRSNKEELLKLGCFKEGSLSPFALEYIGKDNPTKLDEFLAGKFVVQDEAGQLVAPLVDPKEGELILDMCSAPGSKTYHLADLMHNKGKIVAVDLHEHRLKLLTGNLPRLGISCVQTKCYDATKLSELYRKETFDRILLDAPCSGLGVVRRKPDILFNFHQEDLDGLLMVQQNLIDEAVKLLKVGGTLVYSTCTINKKENDGQVRYLLDKYSNMKLLESRQILPSVGASDGFFMAKFIKEENV